MQSSLTIEEAAGLLKVSPEHMRRLCACGKLAGARKVGGQWHISRTADARLVQVGLPTVRGEQVDLNGVPRDKRDAALRKLGVIQECGERVASHVRNGGRADDAIVACAAEQGIDLATFFRWKTKYRQMGLIGLVDNRGGGKFLGEIISPEAFEQFKSLYLDPRGPTLKQCWQNLCFINNEEKKGWTIPVYKRVCELVGERIPLPVQLLYREGMAAYEAKYGSYIQSDAESCEPGEVWIADHCAFNCWIRYRGRWIRPWVTA